MKTWRIFTDGGSRGNPGKAACAFVVFEGESIIAKHGDYLGVATNNEAEYAGLIASLKWVLQQDLSGVTTLEWYTDSLLLMNQVNRQWKIKEPRMREKATLVWEQLTKLTLPHTIAYVPREQNQAADALVNQTLDEIG